MLFQVLYIAAAFHLLSPAVVSSAPLLSNQTSTSSDSDCMFDWLRSLGLNPSPATDYLQLFLREEFNEHALRMTTLDQLKELGITKLGHRTLIFNSLHAAAICENGGVCDLTGDSEQEQSFQCSCLEGFGGERCQYVTGCGDTVCRNGGLCSVEGSQVKCTCAPGFTGTCCEHDVCDQEPCLNGGTCSHSSRSEGYQCTCVLGFEGQHCQDKWLNKSSIQRLTKQVAFLERLHEGDRKRAQEMLLNMKELVDARHGPRFFVRESVIGPPGVIKTAHFSIGHTHYTTFLSHVPTQPQLSGVTVYRHHSNGSLALVQSLPIHSPTTFSVFSIRGITHMAVISAPSEGSAGPNTKTTVYNWTQGFSLKQELIAPGARDVTYVTGGLFHLLVVSCHTSGQGRVENSVVYIWIDADSTFTFYQYLLTNGESVTSVEADRSLVAITSSSKSTIYRWNGTYLSLFQELKAFRDLCLFHVNTLTFLVGVTNHDGTELTSLLYRLDTPTNQFVTHAQLPTPGAVGVEYVHTPSEHFIAFQQDSLSLFSLDGAGAVHFQTLPGISLSLSSFTTKDGRVKLTVSETTEDTDSPNTAVYSWSTFTQ